MGLYLTKRLTESIKQKYSWVGDIRGNGLFQGIEIVHHRQSSETDELRAYPELTKFLVDHLRYDDHDDDDHDDGNRVALVVALHFHSIYLPPPSLLLYSSPPLSVCPTLSVYLSACLPGQIRPHHREQGRPGRECDQGQAAPGVQQGERRPAGGRSRPCTGQRNTIECLLKIIL